MAKAFITSTTKIIEKFLVFACEKNNISTYLMQDEQNIWQELNDTKPDIIFLQANIIEDAKINIVAKIKQDELLGDSFIVIFASRTDGNNFASQVGADAFLPIPFLDTQVASIFRRALNLPKRILLISKTKSCASPIFLSLMERSFYIDTVINGEKGLNYAKTNFPDLIISEIRLTDLQAYEVCHLVNEDPLISHIPFIVLSDTNDVVEIEKCFKFGAKDILLEPFDSDENISKITNIVSPPKKGKKLKALVVDDSGTIRNLISKMFKQLGFEVSTAENGLEGLQLAEKNHPDIITSDYDMPIMSGWEFCTQIKKNPKTNDIPIIMVTSRDSETDIKKGKVLGVSAYLPKPFQIETLEKTVQEVLAEKQKKREREAISKYVASDTIQNLSEVISGMKEQEPEEKFITVLFSDICAFSAKCEKYSARKIVLLLNAYFDEMVAVLHKNNAIIDKFIGDAIVARFDSGDPEEDAFNAVLAAQEMLVELNKFNETSFEQVHIRIGVNSGNVIMGNLGSEKHRLEYAMIGDNVNIGQRLESKAEKQTCLISESTYNLINDRVTVGERQDLSVKGKAQTVNAYTVLELK
jgi:adenylate cyclase